MGLLNELIMNLLVALAHHWYIQKLEQRIGDQLSHGAPMPYQFPYWQRYTDRIFDPQVARRAFRPLASLWPVMPLATVTVFLTVLIVMAFQRADELRDVQPLCRRGDQLLWDARTRDWHLLVWRSKTAA